MRRGWGFGRRTAWTDKRPESKLRPLRHLLTVPRVLKCYGLFDHICLLRLHARLLPQADCALRCVATLLPPLPAAAPSPCCYLHLAVAPSPCRRPSPRCRPYLSLKLIKTPLHPFLPPHPAAAASRTFVSLPLFTPVSLAVGRDLRLLRSSPVTSTRASSISVSGIACSSSANTVS